MHPDGRLDLELQAEPFGPLPHLPRQGLVLDLPGTTARADWYGYGPGESYRDSMGGVRLGRFGLKIEDLATDYVYPQENGNRQDTRWVALGDIQGRGLFVAADSPFGFGAHRYSLVDLDRARHTVDLPRRDTVQLTLDHAQCGLGSGSCGPDTAERHRVAPTPINLALTLRGFDRQECQPVALIAR